uniref:TLDc domain-containing protein n=1 Tax=Chromera velia CCMP2878 TaxID=1169474 RepID=A0A0G4FBU9_9ALVE|eukprot:Cvel_16205.t1-p1 / transcript=Cvel_16205.t1 / gene=Cvel_16205 / organism=Chromera_velia_CCMP2878 / gene_product=hypothetical protein / transcript_product=hypothetical protein / location=Cvel_scaffold1238:6101-7513(+) / protein_length=364 / sequence_SO=supercontig / SO=protein_coding / is_pseudo=false
MCFCPDCKQKMDDTPSRIAACHAENLALVGEIESIETVKSFSYSIDWPDASEARFIFKPKVTEYVRNESIVSFLSDWRFGKELKEDFVDLFNDCLNWKPQTWEEVKKLNEDILRVVNKYLLLSEFGEKAKEALEGELSKYLENLEVLREVLVRVKEEVTARTSRLEEVKQNVEEMAKKTNECLAICGIRPPPSFIGSYVLSSPEQRSTLATWYSGEWRLVYRGTRDGMNAQAFHAKADGLGPTLTLIRCGDNVFGGYTKVPWGIGGFYASDSTARLFTLHSTLGLDPVQFPVKDADRAVYLHPQLGPCFGSGHDLNCFQSGSPLCTVNLGQSFDNLSLKGGAYALLGGSGGACAIGDIEVYTKV